MSQEETRMQQSENDQNLSGEADGEKPEKKKGNASLIGSTVVSVLVWRLFGVVGGLICFGGFWAVCGIAKSKLPLTAKIILCILTAVGFLVLLFLFILFTAMMVK